MQVLTVNVSVSASFRETLLYPGRREQLLCGIAELAGVLESSIDMDFVHMGALGVRIELRFNHSPRTPERLYANDFKPLFPELTAVELNKLGVSKLCG
jgi:hypothetical protein